jgi:glycosyltransferase involved in cell wall biosynthesis
MNLKDKLTIVIPCKNEEKYIEKTFISISNQKNIIDTRVIIADAQSTDNTRKIVNDCKIKYKDLINIELIEGGLVAIGRNNGAKLVKTKYTLFLDADTVIKDNELFNDTIFQMYHYKLDLLTCKVRSYGKDIRTNLMFMLFNPINYFISKKTPFAVGMYFLTKTCVFNELGGFDDTLKHSEDYWLSKQYNPKKFRITAHYIGQDDRRFKKMGYFGMIKLLLKGYINKNNKEFFQKDVNYWD